MTVTQQLELALRLRAREVFDSALRETVAEVKADAPKLTGATERGIRFQNRSVTGRVLRAEIVSTATNQGFDYPAYLNVTRRVAPTRAKYLRFTVGGQTVFSKGFDNTHFRWWTASLGLDTGETVWSRQLAKAFAS